MAFLASIEGFKNKKKKLRSTTTRVTTAGGKVKTERRDGSTGAVLEVHGAVPAATTGFIVSDKPIITDEDDDAGEGCGR